MNTTATFDPLAEAYDSHFTQSHIGRLQRDRVRRYLEPLLAAGPLRILELNCGTGEDALWLAKQGHSVLATDISLSMVEVARRKAKLYPEVDLRVECWGIEEITADRVAGAFDLIFSNFGGWNCLPKEVIAQAGLALQDCLKPGGRLVAVIMPDRCLWETGYFMAKGEAVKAFRRWGRGPAPFDNGEDASIPIWFYSPRAFARLLGQGYSWVKAAPVGLWVPPSYLEKFFYRYPSSLARLGRSEHRWAPRWGARYADHAWVELQHLR